MKTIGSVSEKRLGNQCHQLSSYERLEKKNTFCKSVTIKAINARLDGPLCVFPEFLLEFESEVKKNSCLFMCMFDTLY